MTALTNIVTHTSVQKSTFGFDAVLANFGTTRQVFTVSAAVTPWDNGTTAANAQSIVAVPAQRVTLDPGQNETVRVRDVAWQLGNESFWWPNKPFHEDYTPKLHVLALSVTSSSGEVATANHRFGFVEWSEASNNRTWYTVNGRRINFISDATPEAAMSTYDCYTTSPAFNTLEGAKETWKRYMRVGMSANRIHQSTPTQIMLDAADEVGFALQPETAIRGECPVDRETGALPSGYTDAVKELAHVSRSHPSVFSYSLQNECDPNSIPALLDAISEVDTDRPFVWNDNHLGQPTRMVGLTNGSQHAYAMLHYRTLGCDSSHSFAGGICMQESMLTGLGECAWCIEEGLESYSAIVVEARRYDIAYVAGWDWMCVLFPTTVRPGGYPTCHLTCLLWLWVRSSNYWPNFLEGMNYSAHAWKQTACVSHHRVDGIDGCTLCPAGKSLTSVDGASLCVDCEAGSYSSVGSVCALCNMGYTTLSYGTSGSDASSCSECADDYSGSTTDGATGCSMVTASS